MTTLADGRACRVLCGCGGDEEDRPLTLRPLPGGNYQICCDECGNPVIDDDPKDWRELAQAAIMDMRRYADDELPHRRMVSVRAYEERFALIDRAASGMEARQGGNAVPPRSGDSPTRKGDAQPLGSGNSNEE